MSSTPASGCCCRRTTSAIAVRVGQRPSSTPLTTLKMARVGADAERHRHDRRRGRSPGCGGCCAGRSGRPAPSVSPVRDSHVSRTSSLTPVHGAEVPQRRAPRFGRRHAGADVLLGQHVEMERELAIEVALHPLAQEQRRQAGHQPARASDPPLSGAQDAGDRAGQPLPVAGFVVRAACGRRA